MIRRLAFAIYTKSSHNVLLAKPRGEAVVEKVSESDRASLHYRLERLRLVAVGKLGQR